MENTKYQLILKKILKKIQNYSFLYKIKLDACV